VFEIMDKYILHISFVKHMAVKYSSIRVMDRINKNAVGLKYVATCPFYLYLVSYNNNRAECVRKKTRAWLRMIIGWTGRRNSEGRTYDYWLDRKKEFGRTYVLRIWLDRNMVVHSFPDPISSK
jgi:hypothetical protein